MARGGGLPLEVAAGTSHHGRAPEETGFSPAQRSFDRQGPTGIRPTRRAQAESSSAAPPPRRQRAQERAPRVPRGAGLPLEAAAGTSHHGRAPEERGLSPAQCPFDGRGPTITSPARRAQAACSSAVPPSQRQRAQACAPRVARGVVCHWRSQLARRTTGARRRREASGRRSVLSMGAGRPESGRHGVRKQKARVLRLLHTDSARRSARCAWHAALACRWRLQLECRTTCARRRREASRRRNDLFWSMSGLKSARRRVHMQEA